MYKVAVVMGSDSDLPVMSEAVRVLEKLGIDFDVRIMSAHRTPDEAASFAGGAKENGYGAIIAGAGGAAHLAGVIAAFTTLPVIGVPIKSPALSGLDSLYSIVQMPQGIPVACVAIGGAHNAALLAAQIIGVHDTEVSARLAQTKQSLAESVKSKDAELQKIGYKQYAERISK